jgi:SAM-dependent methyltransferase
MTDKNTDSERWNAHYAGGQPPWDLGSPPPALLDLIASVSSETCQVLVPCAGYGHDAIAWAEAGHEVVAVDFAPRAVEGASEIARTRGIKLTIVQADLFNLKPAYAVAFDIVWEQTCLAALDPERREAYFATMASALRPDGKFYGLLWNHGRSGGPPHDISIDLVQKLAGPVFEILAWDWLDPSVALRRGEYMIQMRKR